MTWLFLSGILDRITVGGVVLNTKIIYLLEILPRRLTEWSASRTVRLGEIGANIGGETAAGLAILAKDYAQFDKPFADSCLMVAKRCMTLQKPCYRKSTYDGGKPFVITQYPLDGLPQLIMGTTNF